MVSFGFIMIPSLAMAELGVWCNSLPVVYCLIFNEYTDEEFSKFTKQDHNILYGPTMHACIARFLAHQ